MSDFEGKKLLVLAGASVHVKVVEAARRLGLTTFVTDYLDGSPAKAVADASWDIDVRDVGKIVSRCRSEGIDGVVSGWIDPCQVPYGEICRELGVPCYATPGLIRKMTNKRAFKAECARWGVGVVPNYEPSDVESGAVQYPVFVKPAESRGSRGQSVCRSSSEMITALALARYESSDGRVLVEKYCPDVNSFQVTLFFTGGEAHVIRTADGYKGSVSEGLDRVALCSVSPSVYAGRYLEVAHDRVVAMLRGNGMQDGPAMLQGFYDGDDFRFYDPGLRFPGVDYDVAWRRVHGVDVAEMMVEFAMTGEMPKCDLGSGLGELHGWSAAVLFPTVRAGRIASMGGFDEIRGEPEVCSVLMRRSVGDDVEWTYDVNQRVAEIDLLCESRDALKRKVQDVVDRVAVVDGDGEDMMYARFDASRIR